MSERDDLDDAAEGRLQGEYEADPSERLTPDEAAQFRLRDDNEGEHVREFVRDVDTSKLKFDDIDPEWTHTERGYSRQDIEKIVRNLQGVQELQLQGADFKRMRESADPRERELANTEHALYSGNVDLPHHSPSAIEVAWEDGQWKVNAGKHRAWMAQHLGVKTIPAIVSAPDRTTFLESRKW